MAIPMPIVQDIRRLDRQGMSRAQIARRLHVDRGTVAKYADMEDCSPKPKADRRYGSKIDPYAHLVDGWLEADRLLPRKQRHTIVYGQINVYGVTTKSERHKRSYWTRTADGNGIGGRKAPVPYGS